MRFHDPEMRSLSVEPKANGLLPKAREAALKALQIDNALAEAYSSLAYIKYIYDYDQSGADRDFRRTIELNPGSSNSHVGTVNLTSRERASVKREWIQPLFVIK